MTSSAIVRVTSFIYVRNELSITKIIALMLFVHLSFIVTCTMLVIRSILVASFSSFPSCQNAVAIFPKETTTTKTENVMFVARIH